MGVVTNTSPLIALAKLNQLILLKGLIASVTPLLEEVRQRGYWLSDTLLDAAKKLAGES